MIKEFVKENQIPKKINYIQFGIISGSEMTEISEIQIVNRELYKHPERIPMPYGVLDLRLGTSDKHSICETCGEKLSDCVGHYGFIKLELPVFHIGYFKTIINILNMVCKNCCHILLKEDEKKEFINKMRNPKAESLIKALIFKKIQEKCKSHLSECPNCHQSNGVVKKVGFFKIIHEKYKGTSAKKEEINRKFYSQFEEAIKYNKDIKLNLSKAQDDLNPIKVIKIFEKIPNNEVELFNMRPEISRPETMILTHLLVPPVTIRPSVAMDTQGSNEDDITMKLTEIININNFLKTAIEKGAAMNVFMEQWDHLQLHIAMLINSDIPGLPSQLGKPIRGFSQRLKGKQGRFRGNLSGKRVDFSSRTVISPDPNLKIDEVAVPELVAKILTYPEKVNQYNIEKMKKLILNGSEIYPGANFIQLSDGSKRFLKFGNRIKLAEELKIGDIVERHLQDGDIVLFNRQPSLHKVSIMCHKVRVKPWRTFRFNECVCTPYNADFDGDEMNLHVPQTEEARAEALTLMGVTQNLITPRNGEPLIAATQDFITSSYLLTYKDSFFDKSHFSLIISGAFDANSQIDIPPPVILKPIELWTGKQIFNVLLKRVFSSKILINVEVKSRSYKKDLYMCPRDGYVCIQNSELMCGLLDKTTLGSGNKNNIFHIIMRDFSNEEAADCMTRLSKMCGRFISNYGFSIGISDVQPSETLTKKKIQLVEDGYNKCNIYIEQFKKGELIPQPGCDMEQTLEAKLNGELSQIRERAGEVCLAELNPKNTPLIMAVCGSKGSNINISQMIACVGQQTVNGTRIPNGFLHRTLPHFELYSKEPPAKGFVKNSFYTGLSPTEFFFHTMGGREGLVDTAVKTAETGYMQRRLMKALEDLSIQYDYTVRNSIGGIVQFVYGDDGLDPAGMEAKERPVDFIRALSQVRAIFPGKNEPNLFPEDVRKILEEELGSEKFSFCSEMFKNEIKSFINSIENDFIEKRKLFNFPTTKDSTYESEKNWNFQYPENSKIVENLIKLTETQLKNFLEICKLKYRRALCEPGTAVGAIGAQSIGEPGTQMTLKTFHFAGVASMNITLGVPRIKEIINASKSISTPIITAKLLIENDLKVARIIKGRIEKTTLGEIAEYIEEVFDSNGCFLNIKLDIKAIQSLQLQITTQTIYPTDLGREKMYYSLQFLKNNLPKIIVKGIHGIERAVISGDEKSGYKLLVEGDKLDEVMTTPGIKGTETTCNHIITVQRVLGIEAARKTIIDEIQTTMQHHGMTIDARHVMLLADVMTYKGEILGITRFGISKMKDSVLMLASFEKTNEHLFDAAIHGSREHINGVSECIIMGIPIPLGTGLFKLLQKPKNFQLTKKNLLLDSPEFNLNIFSKTI